MRLFNLLSLEVSPGGIAQAYLGQVSQGALHADPHIVA